MLQESAVKTLVIIMFLYFPFSSLLLLPLRPSASYNYSEQNTVSTRACIYTVTTELISSPNRIEADRTPATGETKASIS